MRGCGVFDKGEEWTPIASMRQNWGVFVPSATLAIFAWPGGLMGGWIAVLGTVVVLGLVMLRRVLRGAW